MYIFKESHSWCPICGAMLIRTYEDIDEGCQYEVEELCATGHYVLNFQYGSTKENFGYGALATIASPEELEVTEVFTYYEMSEAELEVAEVNRTIAKLRAQQQFLYPERNN